MRLFIVISLSFLVGITRSSKCIYQMRTRTVESGGSVTIPCSYSDLEEQDKDKQIIWGETDGDFCSSAKKIYSPGNVIEKYNGRLYREKDPHRNWIENITITGLEPTDGPTFCCQLYDSKYKNVIRWNTHGTRLQFSDTDYITQMDEVMAVSGEEVIIPCYYSKDTSDITKVIWNIADRATNICFYKPILNSIQAHQKSQYSLVNFTQDISLRIHDIRITDHQSYCCTVNTAQKTLLSKQFTRLIVADESFIEGHRTNEGNGSDENKNIIIIIVVSSVALLIVLIVLLLVLKVKGVICKKKKHFSEQQMNTIPAAGDVKTEEAPYYEIRTKRPEDMPVDGTDEAGSNEMEDGEDGNLLYAKLNKNKLKEKRLAEHLKLNEEVIYADVVKTTSE